MSSNNQPTKENLLESVSKARDLLLQIFTSDYIDPHYLPGVQKVISRVQDLENLLLSNEYSARFIVVMLRAVKEVMDFYVDNIEEKWNNEESVEII